jgi:elongin-C
MATENQSNEMKYGGCEGPEAMYVKLISYDGHEFIIKREYALTSGTIKAMLSGPGIYNFGHFFE